MNMQTDKTSMATSTATSVDIRRILQMIPHRYPMLMVDKVVEMVLNESAVGIKNVSVNEPFFQGHFPSEPVMPGVLTVEAMAQRAAGHPARTSVKKGADPRQRLEIRRQGARRRQGRRRGHLRRHDPRQVGGE